MKEQSSSGSDAAQPQVVEFADLVRTPEAFWDRTVVTRCQASYVFGSHVWLHRVGQAEDDPRNRVAVEPADFRKARNLVDLPGAAGSTPLRDWGCRLLVIAGTIRRPHDPAYAATMTDVLWLDRHISIPDLYDYDWVERKSLGGSNPGLSLGLSVPDAIAAGASLYGTRVRVWGYLIARDPRSAAQSSLAATFDEAAAGPRRILVDRKGLRDRATTLAHIPGVSHMEVWPDQVVKAIIERRLEAADDGDAAAAVLRDVSEACMTTSRAEPAGYYNCFSW